MGVYSVLSRRFTRDRARLHDPLAVIGISVPTYHMLIQPYPKLTALKHLQYSRTARVMAWVRGLGGGGGAATKKWQNSTSYRCRIAPVEPVPNDLERVSAIDTTQVADKSDRNSGYKRTHVCVSEPGKTVACPTIRSICQFGLKAVLGYAGGKLVSVGSADIHGR